MFSADLSFEIQGDDDVLPWIGRKTGCQTRIKASGRITTTQFVIILTISEDVVTRFQMLEDRFNVLKAVRGGGEERV